MKIHVRRRHIVNGDRVSSMSCPIALAVRELVGVTGGPVVVLTSIMRIGRDTSTLPRTARQFIRRFDAGLPVKPFAFVLK